MASDQARDAPLSREAMIGVVERLHRTWSRGDLSVIADLYAPNFTAHFPFGWEFNGRSGVRKAIEDVRRAFSGWTETIQDIIIESDKAVRRYVSTGVQRWPLPRPGSHRRTHCPGRDIDFPFRGAPHSGAVVRDVAPAGRLSVVAWLMVPVSGTEGYADEAEALAKQYESISFAEVHRQVIHLIPTAPSRLLDIGAGTGREMRPHLPLWGIV